MLMKKSTPFKVEETAHKIAKIFILINLRKVKGFRECGQQ
jgi:hypothetical protein